MSAAERWLWDRSGPADPGIRELERVLGRLRWQGGVPPAPRQRRPSARRLLPWLAAAAAVLSAVLVAVLALRGRAAPVRLVVEAQGRELREAEWFIATADARHLTLDRFGELTLDVGSRLRVERLELARTELWLERGRLEAFVGLTARPRFFQVGTPAARCVDLGCRYTLQVDDAGDAWVVVHSGQVAFEHENREVLVPADATCIARRGGGVGTPRFVDCPTELAAALDALDAATGTEARRLAARQALAAAGRAAPRDALSAWHLLADPDPEVGRAAAAHLEQAFGRPAGLEAPAGHAPGASAREAWRRHLERHW